MNKNGSVLLIYLMLFVLSVAILYLPHISPAVLNFSAFMPLFVPFAVVMNFAAAVLLFFLYRRKYILLSLAFLLISFPAFFSTFSFHQSSGNGSYSISTYNVRVFNVYAHLSDKNHNSSKKLISWVSECKSDIICLQEFYNAPNQPVFNTIKKIKGKFPYYHFVPFLTSHGQQFGMAIFSKYPIVNRGNLNLVGKTSNQIVFLDVKFPEDTVRVYNLHLQSMSIDLKLLEDGFGDVSYRSKWLQALGRYYKASILRAKQIEVLKIDLQKQAGKKCIVAGDINDLPYSYVYHRLDSDLQNAFEAKGKGIGTTFYKGKIPLRIDNIFFDRNIEVLSFRIHNDIRFSDHYPITASFNLK